jgi:hypothetical protein
VAVSARRVVLAFLGIAALGLSHAVAAAAAEKVDLLLALMVDVSPSIDDGEFRLQRAGYAAALRDPLVLDSITSGKTGAIAVTFVEWADYNVQSVQVEWTKIHDRESAEAVARRIAAAPREIVTGSTSISGAIDHAARSFDRSGFEAPRRVIDISGDGLNNNGRDPRYARDDAVARGIVINALAIMNEVPTLDRYFEDYVIGGQGAFVVKVADFSDFARAVVTKLVKEIAGAAPNDIYATRR